MAVEHQLREMVRQRLVERYRAQVIMPQVEITAADVGALVGPLESMDGYAVFRVLRREGGQIQPFAEARRRAAASLRRQRENERIGAFIRQLQDKYKDQVVVLVDW